MPSIKNNNAIASLDLGSNSFRLLIAQPDGQGFNPLVKELRTVRLAEGLQDNQLLNSAAIGRGLEALGYFRQLLEQYQPGRVKICATAALRQAKNSAEFCQAAAMIVKNPVEILSGQQEAALSLSGVLHGFPTPPSGALWILDVGGGSTECIKSAGQPGTTVSLPIGAVNLTESYLSSSPPTAEALLALAFRVRSVLASSLCQVSGPPSDPGQSAEERPPTLIGTGGTATALAALDLGLKKYDDTLVHRHILTAKRLGKIMATLAPLLTKARNLLPGLGQGRGEIILAGGVIFQELLRYFAVKQLLISDCGLLEGIWLSANNN